MTAIYILFIIVTTVAILLAYPSWRDKRILKRPFSAHWQDIVKRRLPFLQKLNKAEQKQLRDMIKLFVAKKHFYGCGGLEINDDIRVTIAAEACLLLLNRHTGIYPSLKHILVYPSAFRVERQKQNSDGTVSQMNSGLLGESWDNSKVVLSWDNVEHGIENFNDGHNVVLHEFSHQLDSESGSANGAPILKKNSYQLWAKVLSKEFEALVKASEGHDKAVMDYYGATNPAEFFAVATEVFFEKPQQMSRKHPELYNQFKTYYCVDPLLWL
jgi:Mlc titration factor MtfA (ptsG expression regulator)